MTPTLLMLYRHTAWATLRLIAYCQALDDQYLDATMPGTYGTIRDTLRHLVGAEERYFWTVTGERFSEPLPEGPVALADLADRIRRLGSGWEKLAESSYGVDGEVTTWDGWRVPAAVPMAQAIHHADDHRSQILSMLGARGLEVPELSVWDYALSSGIMHEEQAG